MELKGTLKQKGTPVQVSEKFRKLDFVVTDNSSSQYPQHIAMQLVQDKCSLLDDVNAGDEIEVHFNLRGREWTSPSGEIKYFNTIDAWKINKMSSGSPANVAINSSDNYIPDEPLPKASTIYKTVVTNQQDDLPF